MDLGEKWNALLFPDSASLSVSRIKNGDREKRLQKAFLRIVEWNDTSPFIGVDWDGNQAVRAYLCVETKKEAFDLRMSLQSHLGSVATYPSIEVIDPTNAQTPYEKSILSRETGFLLLRVTTLRPIDLPKSKMSTEGFNNWLAWVLEKILCCKALWHSKPSTGNRVLSSAAALLSNFSIDLYTGDRGRLRSSFAQLKSSDLFDARNIDFFAIKAMGALGEHEKVLNFESVEDVLKGRITDGIQKVFLEAFYYEYLIGSVDKLWFDREENSVAHVRALTDNWKQVFLKQPAYFEHYSTEAKCSLLVGSVAMGNLVPQSVFANGFLNSEWLVSLQNWGGDSQKNPRVLEPVPPRTEEINHWGMWLDQYPSLNGKALQIATEYGADWAVSNEAVTRYVQLINASTEIQRSQILRGTLPAFCSSLDQAVDKVVIDSAQLNSILEVLALDDIKTPRDLGLANMLLRLIALAGVSEGQYKETWEATALLIENGRLTGQNLPEIVGVLETIADYFMWGSDDVLGFWISKVVPLIERSLSLSSVDFSFLRSFSESLGFESFPEQSLRGDSDIPERYRHDRVVGIYSLDQNALGRVSSFVKNSFPGVQVLTNSDSSCTEALKHLSKTSDVVFFAAGKAKHQAFFCVKKDAEEKIQYPKGNGSTSLVRAISDYLTF